MLRAVQPGSPRVAAVTRVAGLAGAGHGADLSRPIHDPKGMARSFQDVEVTPAVERHRPGIDQRCTIRRVVSIGGHAFLAVARHGRDDARLQVDLPHPAIIEIRQAERLIRLVEGQAVDPAELRLQRPARHLRKIPFVPCRRNS